MNVLLQAALLSLLLALIKFIVFLMTGSMIVVASFADSFADAAISFLNFKMQHLAREAADADHPFGHGGYEVLSSLIQGLIICGAGGLIIFESITRLFTWQANQAINMQYFSYAFATMLLSAAAGYGIHRILARKSQKSKKQGERSLTLEADKAHYLSDMLVNAAGAAGLLLVFLSESQELDAIFGLLGGVLVLRAGIPILKKSSGDIMHVKLEESMQQQLVDIIQSSHPKILGLHRFRSRRHGPMVFLDFHLKLPHRTILSEAHDIGEIVSRNIKRKFKNIDLLIHLDPDNEPDDEIFDPTYTVDNTKSDT